MDLISRLRENSLSYSLGEGYYITLGYLVHNIKSTAIQIEKALINDCFCVSKVS